MVTYFSDGFESNDLTAWTGTWLGASSTYAASNTIAHTGTYSGKATTAAASRHAQVYKTLSSAVSEIYWRCYCAAPAFASNNQLVSWMGLADSAAGGGTAVALVYIWNSAGSQRFCVRNCVTSTNYNTATFPAAFVANQWYLVELYVKVGDADGVIKVWLDGVEKYNQTGIDTNTGASGSIKNLWAGINSLRASEASTVYNDCCLASDAYIGAEVTYLPGTRTNLASTMATMLNSKIMFG